MILFYLTIITILLMVAYAGIEGTLRLFLYYDYQFKFLVMQIGRYFLGRKLRRQLTFIRKDLHAKRTPIEK